MSGVVFPTARGRPRRHADLRVSLLNLLDRDCRLNPLTLYTDLPHERTLAVSLKFCL